MRNTLLATLCALALAACAPSSELHEDDESSADSDEGLSGTELRFDLATLSCASPDTGEVCPPENEKCLCRAAFDKLNHSRESHFVVVGSDNLKAEILAKGNKPAAYVDQMNTGYLSMGGIGRADKVMNDLSEKFPTGVPKWIFVNEISAGRWPDEADYRAWVVAFAKRLNVHYGKNVVIAATSTRPGHNADAWSALAKYAYIGGELYLTGAEINKSGNSVAYCREQYQESIDAYARVGVPLSRLMIIEHFGSTVAGTNWGRSGVSPAGWKNAIEARGEAARQLGFAGYVTYAWGSNKMHETQAQRLEYIDTYAKTEVLP